MLRHDIYVRMFMSASRSLNRYYIMINQFTINSLQYSRCAMSSIRCLTGVGGAVGGSTETSSPFMNQVSHVESLLVRRVMSSLLWSRNVGPFAVWRRPERPISR